MSPTTHGAMPQALPCRSNVMFTWLCEACWVHQTVDLQVQVSELLQTEGNCKCEYAEYEGCGHVPMDEMPDKFMADLQRFVTDVASDRQPLPRGDTLTDRVDDAPLPLYPPSKTAPVQD